MAALDQEDVIDQLADGCEPAAGLDRGLDGGRVGAEPSAPGVTLFGGIPKQFVDRESEGHASLSSVPEPV
jgi:hypothetical protein